MQFITFSEDLSKISKVILIKESSLNRAKVEKHYINPTGLSPEEFIVIGLPYNGKKAPKADTRKEFLVGEVLPEIDAIGATEVYIADTEYFKTLTKKQKVTDCYGEFFECKMPGYDHIEMTPGINYTVLTFNPTMQELLDLTLISLVQGSNLPDIIESAYYPFSLDHIKNALEDLHQYSELTVDIEGYSLAFWECGIGTISFAWDEHNGIAFDVDQNPLISKEIRKLLVEFFESYEGTLTGHNLSFDFKVLIFQLWMDSHTDYEGMLKGIETLTRDFEDTKLIAYLATNNTVKNTLGLKELSRPFAGNYGQDNIHNIKLIDPAELLEYNLKDCLSTWYVKEKFYPKMVTDNQLDIYENLFKPALINLLQIELTGMPIDPEAVQVAKQELQKLSDRHMRVFSRSTIIDDFWEEELDRIVVAANKKLKTKVKTVADFPDEVFNPNSGNQLQRLLYDYLGLPVLDLTKNKQPATGGKTLKKLINHTSDPKVKEILEHLIDFVGVNKILTSFIPAFEKAVKVGPGDYRLFGNFNLGGTLSGRLSSSDPNLQNLPSSSAYAKIIKKCFKAPEGWLFVGADYASLEDRINALVTKDPNKLKVYTDHFDGHCLRAYAYFGDKMPDITLAVETDKCYTANVGGTDIRFKGSDTINYQGTAYTGEELYGLLTN